jgi:hypothetical protein
MTAAIRNRLQLTAKSLELFAKKDLIDERQLHGMKWFDYRFMTPMEATMKFREVFQEFYQNKYSRNIDSPSAETKFGVRNGEATSHPAEFTSFWRVRQQADELGVPYNVFLDAALEVLLRNGFERVPYINQLSKKHRLLVGTAVWQHWVEYKDSWFRFSGLPQYRNESFSGLRAQTDHRAWVLDEIDRRGAKARAIGAACFVDRVITEELAEARFGREKVDLARDEVKADNAVALDPVDAAGKLPSCAGLPGAYEVSSDECRGCQYATLCSDLVGRVIEDVVGRTGSDEPVAARKRLNQATRTRKCRANKLAA